MSDTPAPLRTLWHGPEWDGHPIPRSWDPLQCFCWCRICLENRAHALDEPTPMPRREAA